MFRGIFRLVLAFYLLICSSNHYCQSGSFTVLNVSGRPLIQKGGSGEWSAVFTGNKVNSDDKLKLGIGDYIAFLSPNSVSIDLSKPGVYDFEKVQKKVSKGQKASFSDKYGNMLANEISKKSVSNEMKMLGAVSRLRPNQLFLAFPNVTNCLTSSIKLSWYKNPSSSAYLVSVINNQRRCIYMEDTKDTIYNLDRNKLKLQPGTDYYLAVRGIGSVQSESDSVKINFLPDEMASAIYDSIAANSSDEDFASSAVSNLSAGVFLENYQCYYEADKYLNKSLILSSGLPGFLEHYLQFLLKTGQEKKAIEVQKEYLK